MPKNYTKEIFRAIGRLEGQVTEGFKGVHSRLDKLNGRVDDHGKKIGVNKSNIDVAKGKAMGAGFVAGVIGSVITIILAVLTLFRK